MPNDPLFLNLSEEELGFMAYWLRKGERDKFDALAEVLGTKFHRSDFIGAKAQTEPTDEILIPLSFLLEPQTGKWVKAIFKKTPAKAGKFHGKIDGAFNMGELSTEEYMQMRAQLGDPVKIPPKTPPKPKAEETTVPKSILDYLTGPGEDD